MKILQNYTVDLFSINRNWFSYKGYDVSFQLNTTYYQSWESYEDSEYINDLPKWIEEGRATKVDRLQ